ncbi:type II toxin-antitoxin system VapC family toxin [Flavobacterium sp. CS20]|jgi:predicted nucleic acid-binding protein|uniref:type II toxin-antitoxin system VapC family toxin n=1 Tax=Flavobacterium sp. CS20 TaxID=2775246 RepID=UPI001B39F6FE|nr:type II toxin-antitoxin system VapC family toxin [Flavobacterium sp. CS20]QTY26838.1 type II toxin-antitoxin system VapC family toxin [Flavobacterium sp. CS20]
MNKLLLDSNIIIGVANGKFDISQIENTTLLVSEITRLEVFGYHKLRSQEEKLLEQFFKNIQCLPVSKTIINLAIEFRKQKSMSIGDAIIATIAINHKLPLSTANTKDFQHIEKLDLVNPLEI